MQTMQPVLQTGPFDRSANPLTADVFSARIAATQALMKSQGWAGLMVFGNRSDYGTINYLSAYTPRLGDALLLIPAAGDAKIFAFEGRRMVEAAKETGWLDDVAPVVKLADDVGSWLGALGEGPVAICHFDEINDDYHRIIAALPRFAGAVDGTSDVMNIRRTKSAAEIDIIKAGATSLMAAERAAYEFYADGADALRIGRACESSAYRSGVQDVRMLFTLDGGETRTLLDRLPDHPVDRLGCYLAVRYWGYWIKGFFTVGKQSPADRSVGQALGDVLAQVRAGTELARLANVAKEQGASLIHASGVGCWPSLEDAIAGAVLKTGDVFSIGVAAGTKQQGVAEASALVRVTADGPETIWKSGNGQRSA